MPQIPDINPTMANRDSISGVRIDNPEVRDVRYLAKAQKYEKIGNILEKAGSEYQQKWERKKEVERRLIGSQEGMNANMAGQQLLQDAQGLPDDQVMPFITKGMEKINADAYKKYGNDSETWGQVSLNIQRANAEVQDKAFNFVQTRAKDNALALAVQNEALLKNTAITDSNQAAVNLKFKQYDDQLDALVKAGYMAKESAAKSSLDFRGQVMIGRISNMANNDNFAAAYQTLEANRAMIPLMAQVQLENSIATQAKAKEKFDIKQREDAVALREKYLAQAPSNPGGAAKVLGANTPELVFSKSGNLAVDDQEDIDKYVASPMNDATYDELTQLLDAHQQRLAPKPEMVEVFREQVLSSKTLKPNARLAIQLRNDGFEEQARMLQDGIKDTGSYTAAFEKIGTTNGLAQDAIIAEMRSDTSMKLYSQWLNESGEGQYATETTDGVVNIAKNYMLKHPKASAKEAYNFARRGTADSVSFTRFNGSLTPVPVKVDVNRVHYGLEILTKKEFPDDFGRKNVIWKLSNDGKDFIAYFKDSPDDAILDKAPDPNDPQVMIEVPIKISVENAQNVGAAKAQEELIKRLNLETPAQAKSRIGK